MTKVLFLKGLPASGKTTYARDLVSSTQDHYVRINKDDLRAMFHNSKWGREREGVVLDMQLGMAETALRIGRSIVIDDTNFNPKHEARFRQLAEQYNAEFEVKFFDTPVEECIERDKKRPNSVGAKVIRDMWRQYLWKRPEAPPINEALPLAIVVDLDGTLCNIDHRVHHVVGKPKRWDKFFAEMPKDKLNDWCKMLILAAVGTFGCKLVFCSGRPEKYREVTEKWLADHTIENYELFMRPNSLADGEDENREEHPDYRPDDIVKQEIYDGKIKGKYNVLFVVDDRRKVVDMWRRNGLTCLQCDEGEF